MRTDLPACDFVYCLFQLDGNCRAGESRRAACKYAKLPDEPVDTPASPWRRVEERLPDDSRDVIIFTASGIVGIGSFIRPNWYQWYSGGGLPVDVTHWMEKPEPPKEDA